MVLLGILMTGTNLFTSLQTKALFAAGTTSPYLVDSLLSIYVQAFDWRVSVILSYQNVATLFK